MIGKAIHTILKNMINDLSSGKVFPTIMPQNVYQTLSSPSYPAIIYNTFTTFEKSKDDLPNIKKVMLNVQVVSNKYEDINIIGKKVRDVLDQYIDKSTFGLDNVPGYIDSDGYEHNFVSNVDINKIFYTGESDNYLDDLFLHVRSMDFDLYYYEDINKLSYETNDDSPLYANISFKQRELLFNSDSTFNHPGTGGGNFGYLIQKLGKAKLNNVETNNIYQFEAPSGIGLWPRWDPEGFALFENAESLQIDITTAGYDVGNFPIASGAMLVYVYKPTETGPANYLSGKGRSSTESNVLISHDKNGSDIKIRLNTSGSFSTNSSDTVDLVSTTDSANYWSADLHFLCVSISGNKNATGGTKNGAGWFEYFNSDYNPKLTTGQILQNNSFAGNTTNLSHDQTWGSIGGYNVASGGFRIYENLVFIPKNKKTHDSGGYDVAPFQPTDIIYKTVKNYIYNKYESLN